MNRTLALPVAGAVLLTAASASAASLLTSGHVDAIKIGYHGGHLEPHMHAEGAIIDGILVDDAEYAPADLTIVVPNSTALSVASSGGREAGAAWDLIGVPAGQSFWFLPQSSATASSLGAPYAGISAGDLLAGDWIGNVAVKLTAANMPLGGQFSLAQVSLGVPTFFMSTFDGLDANDVVEVAPGDHAHFNWYFTQPGQYDLTFEVSGTHVLDGPMAESATFRFAVIPEPSSALLAGLGALALLRRRR